MNDLDEVAARLTGAKSLCVFTGAGISAESGVPTFRGENGLWKKFKPEELANFDAFLRNPGLVWEWYSYRRNLMKDVQPNPGHFALVELEKAFTEFTLVTQNVDNLHRRAGSGNVVELHGNIERNYCIDCHAEPADTELPPAGTIPRCSRCGGLIRPDVVWFGELLPMSAFAKAEAAAQSCDVFLCIGTSSVVYPAASLPYAALNGGAFVAEINPGITEFSVRAHVSIRANAGAALPELMTRMNARKRGSP